MLRKQYLRHEGEFSEAAKSGTTRDAPGKALPGEDLCRGTYADVQRGVRETTDVYFLLKKSTGV
jgi:hypothetical protein